jgi:hypothetical protein
VLELPTFTLTAWGLATALTLFLLVRIFLLRMYRRYPFFTFYLGANLLQTAFLSYLYQSYGFSSTTHGYRSAWATQAFVVVARGFAAAEVCYRVLGKFKGVWALAMRILIACGAIVLISTLYFGIRSYQFTVITLEMSLEAFIATWIVGLLLIARYYVVPVEPAAGMVGLGLGLLSCCRLLNDLVLERHVQAYLGVWNYVSGAAFLGILLLWNWYLRGPAIQTVRDPQLNTLQVYQSLIPQVNRKLAEVNQHLRQFGRPESPKP